MKYNRWLITVRCVQETKDVIKTIIHENTKKTVNFSNWLDALSKSGGYEGVAILNIQRLPPRARGSEK